MRLDGIACAPAALRTSCTGAVTRKRAVRVRAMLIALALVILPSLVRAQSASGIAGVVKDTSGAVLPGVTVEATSPALIEKVRTVVADSDGQYNITDLRPGIYTVTFALAGFDSVRREDIELPSGFTATVNVEMRVGALEETITVSGASPLVDTRNAQQRSRVSEEVLAALPTSSKTWATLAALTPGMVGNVNVGGAAGWARSSSPLNTTVHGKANLSVSYDGFRVTNMTCPSCQGFVPNPPSVQEWVVETAGGAAENSSFGAAVNYVPKDGGNMFKFTFDALYTNDHLQSNNLTDELRQSGLTTVNKVHYLYNLQGGLGGPIKRDRLWFYTSHWLSGNKNRVAGVFFNQTQGTPFYTPDPDRPGFREDDLRSHAVRLTWQASSRNKINIHTDFQNNCICRGRGEFLAPEAQVRYDWDNLLSQVTWSSPVTNRLLLEAGAAATIAHYPISRMPESTPQHISVTEQSTGLVYNGYSTFGANSYGPRKYTDRYGQRFAASYVTGSHAFKAGIQAGQGIQDVDREINGDVTYRFRNAVPNQITQYATPFRSTERLKADLGVFAQDQWTIKRLTVNVGLRFDYYNAYVPEQHLSAGPWVPARDFSAVHGVPEWTDLSPRIGAAYDLFGNGATAIKVSLGRYVSTQAVVIAGANNPVTTSVATVNRTWDDANGNYVPDCELRSPAANGECGTMDNQNFGQLNIRTRYADDVIRGFGRRDYLWDFSTEVQQQLGTRVSFSAGYYRNSFYNFTATDNLQVNPADFSAFCVTAPRDVRLPGGGGYQVCGLYDIAPAKFGLVNNLVTQASHYGRQTRTSGFVGVYLKTRFKDSDKQIGGGVDTGRTVSDACFVVDSPQQLLNCHVVTPFGAQTQLKLFGSYPLPMKFIVSGVFQNTPGAAISAIYNATNAEIAPTLGRSLAACGNRVPCTATAAVPLIAPQTQFGDRRTQLDLRLSKLLRVGYNMGLRANLDVYNVLNASSVLAFNSTYSGRWPQPTPDTTGSSVLDGRLFQVSAQLSF